MYHEVDGQLVPVAVNMPREGDTLRAHANDLVGQTVLLTGWVNEKAYRDTTVSADIASVYAGGAFTAGVTTQGYAYMWGTNGNSSGVGGILGNRKSEGIQTTPGLLYRKEIGGGYLDHVVRLSTVSGTNMSRHILAHIGQTNAGTGVTYAWGNNSKGQLSTNSQISVTVPTVVGSGTISLPETYILDISEGGLGSRQIDVRSNSKGYLLVYGTKLDAGGMYSW